MFLDVDVYYDCVFGGDLRCDFEVQCCVDELDCYCVVGDGLNGNLEIGLDCCLFVVDCGDFWSGDDVDQVVVFGGVDCDVEFECVEYVVQIEVEEIVLVVCQQLYFIVGVDVVWKFEVGGVVVCVVGDVVEVLVDFERVVEVVCCFDDVCFDYYLLFWNIEVFDDLEYCVEVIGQFLDDQCVGVVVDVDCVVL